MSFIVAFSSSNLYGIIGTSENFDSIKFGYFINELARMTQNRANDDSRCWRFVMDNAIIHKSKEIKRIIQSKKSS